MKTNKKILSLFALLVIGLVLASSVVNAYRGTFNEGPYYNEEIHAELQEAIENGDYNTWITIREENNLPMKGRIFEVINEDNFSLFTELHEAVLAGDETTINEIKEELGLGTGMQKRQGQGMRHGFMQQ